MEGDLRDENLKMSSGDLRDENMKLSSGDSRDENLKLSSGDLGHENLKLSSGDLRDENLKLSSGDLRDENLKLSSGDLGDENLKLSSGDLRDENLKMSSGDLRYENLKWSSGDLSDENLKLSSGDLDKVFRPAHGTVITVCEFGGEISKGLVVASDSLVTYLDIKKKNQREHEIEKGHNQKVFRIGHQVIAGAGNGDVIDHIIKKRLSSFRNPTVFGMTNKVMAEFEKAVVTFEKQYGKKRLKKMKEWAPKYCELLICGYNGNLPEVRLVYWDRILEMAVNRLIDIPTSIGCGAPHAMRLLKKQKDEASGIWNSVKAIVEAMLGDSSCGGHIDYFVVKPLKSHPETLIGGVEMVTEKLVEDLLNKAKIKKRKQMEKELGQEVEESSRLEVGESSRATEIRKKKNRRRQERRDRAAQMGIVRKSKKGCARNIHEGEHKSLDEEKKDKGQSKKRLDEGKEKEENKSGGQSKKRLKWKQ